MWFSMFFWLAAVVVISYATRQRQHSHRHVEPEAIVRTQSAYAPRQDGRHHPPED